MCEGTCGADEIDCTTECKPAGCYCDRGYVRYLGKCILAEKCPRNIITIEK